MNNFKKLAGVAAVVVVIGVIVATFIGDGWKRYVDIALCSVYGIVHVPPEYHPHTGGLGACP